MASRVILNGREVWHSHDWKVPVVAPPVHPKTGEPMPDALVRPGTPDSPFRAGVPRYDSDDDLTYRIVSPKVLDPRQGWATAGFWLERWKCSWAQLKTLVEMAWVDAAIEQNSAIKRFRCRDETRVRMWLVQQKQPAARKTPRTRR